MEAAHVVGLEAPAKGTLEPPVGSDLDGGGCPAALQGVSGPLNGGGEPVVDVVVFYSLHRAYQIWRPGKQGYHTSKI